MQVGTRIKFFTARMFGVVVTGSVVKVSKDGKRAKVTACGGGSSWTETVHIDNVVS
jgi:hypothetical protein